MYTFKDLPLHESSPYLQDAGKGIWGRMHVVVDTENVIENIIRSFIFTNGLKTLDEVF